MKIPVDSDGQRKARHLVKRLILPKPSIELTNFRPVVIGILRDHDWIVYQSESTKSADHQYVNENFFRAQAVEENAILESSFKLN